MDHTNTQATSAQLCLYSVFQFTGHKASPHDQVAWTDDFFYSINLTPIWCPSSNLIWSEFIYILILQNVISIATFSVTSDIYSGNRHFIGLTDMPGFSKDQCLKLVNPQIVSHKIWALRLPWPEIHLEVWSGPHINSNWLPGWFRLFFSFKPTSKAFPNKISCLKGLQTWGISQQHVTRWWSRVVDFKSCYLLALNL